MTVDLLETGQSAVLVTGLHVDDLNAEQSALIIGPPGPTAICGLAHALERFVQHRIRIVASTAICHAFSAGAGHPKVPVDTRAVVVKGQGAASIVDDIRGRAIISILLVVEPMTDDPYDAFETLPDDVAAFFARSRIMGGTVVGVGFRRHEVSADRPWVLLAEDNETLARLLRRVSGGVVLRDRSDLMTNALEQGQDALDALLDAVGLAEEEKSGQKRWKRRQPGWIVPVHRGYQAISSLAERSGMRTGDAVEGHVFAEPVTGLAEWITVRRALPRFDGCLWQYDVAPETGRYFVSSLSLNTENSTHG